VIERMAQWALRRLPAETAHNIALRGMLKRRFAPGVCRYNAEHEYAVLGTRLPNPLGLAAGFDKAGVLPGVIRDYGFGYVEVGSVCWEPHRGNPRPRMFRVDDWDVQNRMGLNGPGAERVLANLDGAPDDCFGVSVAKSNKPGIVGDRGLADVLRTFMAVRDRGFYTVLNLSCPNTEHGTTFEAPEILDELLPDVAKNAKRPWGVKLGPAGDFDDLDKTLDACEAHGCQFYVMGNTAPADHPKFGKGGRSGRSLRPLALERMEHIRVRLPRARVIACGGIFTGSDMTLYELKGAHAYQALNGFVRGPYSGPTFAHRVIAEWQAISEAL